MPPTTRSMTRQLESASPEISLGMPPVTRSMTYAAGLPIDHVPQSCTNKPPQIGDLPGVIHPIFRRNGVHNKIDYDLIQPALRFATRLISTPALLPFWYTLFFSDVRPVDHMVYSGPRDSGAYEYCVVPSVLTDEQVKRTQTALINFGHKVWFSLWTSDLEGLGFSQSAICTVLLEDENFTYVIFSPETFSTLEQSAALTRRTGDPSYYMLESHYVGSAFVHELAHAEDGFDWESRTFGGLVETCLIFQSEDIQAEIATGTPGVYAELSMWPSAQQVCNYIFKGKSFGLRLSDDRAPLIFKVDEDKAGGVAVPLNFSYIAKMFTKAFWEHEVVEKGAAALLPGGLDWRKSIVRQFLREWVFPLVEAYRKSEPMLDLELEAASAAMDKRSYYQLRRCRRELG